MSHKVRQDPFISKKKSPQKYPLIWSSCVKKTFKNRWNNTKFDITQFLNVFSAQEDRIYV